MPPPPKELVEAAKKGDKDAFGEIYRLFLSRIYRFVYYLVYDESLAEDITQDTFIKAWKAMPGFSLKKGTIQAYLFTIARNLVIDNQRKKKEISLEAVVVDFEGSDNLEKSYIDSEERGMVRKALTCLDGAEKQMVILRYFEEFSYAEIARVVGKNEGTIRVKVHRTLGKLKDYIQRKKL